MVANTLLTDSRLDRHANQFLADHRPAFLFGNTAPDVQTVSGQARRSTHFFSIPIRDNIPAEDLIFTRYSSLAQSEHLPEDQVAFLAGYIAHLLLDQLWIKQIFQPYFGDNTNRKTFQHQLFLHNILRVYLDRRDRHHLPVDLGDIMSQAQPREWLPFVEDSDLRQWRDFIVGQLAPDAEALTIEVFAKRMNRKPEEFEAVLNSRHAMDVGVFSRIPDGKLNMFQYNACKQSVELLCRYLSHLK